MKTKPRKLTQQTPPPRTTPVKRYLLYGMLIIAAIGVRLWFVGPKVPMPDLTDATPELETAVNAAAARIDEAPSAADAWGKYGMLLAAHRFTVEAVAAYDKANELAPHDWRWPYLKFVALEHADPPAGLAALRESARLGRADDDLPALELASVLLDSGQPAEAERVLRPIIYGGELPNNPAGQILLARALILQDKLDDSLKVLSHSAEASLHSRKAAYELLSHVHARLANYREAANARRIAQTLPPDEPIANPLREKLARMHTNKEAYIAQVNQLRHLGRFEELERVGQEGFAKFPELTHFSQGQTALLDGHPTDAETSFRQALAVDPDWIDALIGLGDSLAEQNKQAAAEEVLREAIKREPSNGSAHLRLAKCLLTQDKHNPAVEAFQQAVLYLPLSAEAHDGLADALSKTGRSAEADEHRRHAKSLAAESPHNAREEK
jgi:tetratricopeptide (TPR) repeat protein